MTLKEIAALSNARVIHENGHLDKVIRHAFAADLMSDVLRLDTSEMILITGLANLQVIRTAEMSDISFHSICSRKTSLSRYGRISQRV